MLRFKFYNDGDQEVLFGRERLGFIFGGASGFSMSHCLRNAIRDKNPEVHMGKLMRKVAKAYYPTTAQQIVEKAYRGLEIA